ncbi:TlpA family protein disulfide reductase [Hymenobacter mucosus]|uniref:Thiol-disulfide isomerase or thioredoxin n=1 Tax=Hymenobacter mucosus TaxID=1411120 RepID=A0A238W503_9BACT|nr:TlpA disulfide reductase family protein [Hymenobacter mucosus]SNR41487.1 Thiol-disulfide isomerase or thioredoxin [Hymenobacter mucosus]
MIQQYAFGVLFLGVSVAAHAQQVVRYRSTNNKLYTEAQVDSMVAARNQKMEAQGLDMRFAKKVTATQTQGDTTVHTFGLTGASKAVLESQARYASFIGKPLPPFSLPDVQGKMVHSDQLRGQPVVINMWFTTCAPCIAEIPALNQFKAGHPSVVFLAMTYEGKDKVLPFLQKRRFAFRQVADAKAYCALFTQQYPISIFVDRQGLVRQILQALPMRYDVATKQLTEDVNPAEFQASLQIIELNK